MCSKITITLSEKHVPEWYDEQLMKPVLSKILYDKLSFMFDEVDCFVTVLCGSTATIEVDEQSIEIPTFDIEALFDELAKETGNLGVDDGWYYYIEPSFKMKEYRVMRITKENNEIEIQCVGSDPGGEARAMMMAYKMACSRAATNSYIFSRINNIHIKEEEPKKLIKAFNIHNVMTTKDCWFVPANSMVQ